ncbi:serine/threonine protein kinase [Haliangium ochraceum DSM 14365]|uniref:Serine/threonine protein kinase n=2 Tax=Haliangium ochraceum TaxID=80816 RepID=D0LXN5_HALO1|nr:serine/threonine protein kinase [Haliangium ochraceum DSM 14365]
MVSASPVTNADEVSAPDSDRTVVDRSPGQRLFDSADLMDFLGGAGIPEPVDRSATERAATVLDEHAVPAHPAAEEVSADSVIEHEFLIADDELIEHVFDNDMGLDEDDNTAPTSIPDDLRIDAQKTARYAAGVPLGGALPPPSFFDRGVPDLRDERPRQPEPEPEPARPSLLDTAAESPAPEGPGDERNPQRGFALPPPRVGRSPRTPGRRRSPREPLSAPESRPPAAPVKTDEPSPSAMVASRYRIVERIGSGGMGKVFRVSHARLGKTFALKIIRDSMAGEDRARDLFFREARLASSLSHPNIASVVDYGEDARIGAFMVMEFLQGETLNRLLKRERRLSVRQAIDIIHQVAEALHYIHSKGIVHCDIKTENILLTEVPDTKRRRLQVKLLDFGLARSTAATRNTNSLAGTPHYVAPERIRGKEASPSSDIYGLGILFYELLTGRVPWEGTVDEILSGHLNLPPVPPSRLIEQGLDPAVEKLILRALAKTPEKRHKDIAAFLYELRTVIDMLGFGRRRGARRVVVERQGNNQRDELTRAMFDACRVPMALLDRSGMILVANPAFAQFVTGITMDVEGSSVETTPLGRVWSTFTQDLARACYGNSLRRRVELEMASGEIRRLMLWLDPGLNENQAIFGVHPLDD